MKIAIDISPLQSGHSIRGVGFYVQHLKEALIKYDTRNTYEFFTEYAALGEHIDILHFPYFDPFFFTLPIRKKYKTVVTVHDLTPIVFSEHFPAGIKGNVRWMVQKRLLTSADHIVTDSFASQHDICSIVGVEKKKVDVVYLAAGEEYRIIPDKNLLEKVREKYHLPEKFVLYVGDATWNKDLPSLVKAIQDTDIPLVMVGKALAFTEYDINNPWNRDLAFVQDFIKNKNQFHVLGFLPTDDLVALYNLATLAVMPSIYEGFGLPVLEAMQCGTPVIATHGGSLKEIANDAAYIVPIKNSTRLASGIRDVFTNYELQQSLRKKGLANAQQFSWEKTAKQMIAVYEKSK